MVPAKLSETVPLQSLYQFISCNSDIKKIEHPLDFPNRVSFQVFVSHHQQRVCWLSLYNVVVNHVLPFLGLLVDNGFPLWILPYIN